MTLNTEVNASVANNQTETTSSQSIQLFVVCHLKLLNKHTSVHFSNRHMFSRKVQDEYQAISQYSKLSSSTFVYAGSTYYSNSPTGVCVYLSLAWHVCKPPNTISAVIHILYTIILYFIKFGFSGDLLSTRFLTSNRRWDVIRLDVTTLTLFFPLALIFLSPLAIKFSVPIPWRWCIQ